jgi:SAM-dependent methyltransferase
MRALEQISLTLQHASVWCKLLLLLVVVAVVNTWIPGRRGAAAATGPGQEGFGQEERFVFRTDVEGIYDPFYASVYDHLLYSDLKDDYEVGEIIAKTRPTARSRILDVGCGTGHHVAALAGRLGSDGAGAAEILGIDKSPAMVAEARKKYPELKFEVADAMDAQLMTQQSFTHVLCLYFTVYYLPDRERFFRNVFGWLMPGGYFVVHLVDRDNFDPILPPGNPLTLVSPQRYTGANRITSTRVRFEGFQYDANFEPAGSGRSGSSGGGDTARFREKFTHDDGRVRKNTHVMDMPDLDAISNQIQSVGFILLAQIDLVHCQYEYQYLYVYQRPN